MYLVGAASKPQPPTTGHHKPLNHPHETRQAVAIPEIEIVTSEAHANQTVNPDACSNCLKAAEKTSPEIEAVISMAVVWSR